MISLAEKLQLKVYAQYAYHHLINLDDESKKMIMGTAPYGDHPTFSLTINHKQTYTRELPIEIEH